MFVNYANREYTINVEFLQLDLKRDRSNQNLNRHLESETEYPISNFKIKLVLFLTIRKLTLIMYSLGFSTALGHNLVVISFRIAFRVIKASGCGEIFNSCASWLIPS